MPEIAEVFRKYGPDYLDRFSDRMLPSHLSSLEKLVECRTESLGGHLFVCLDCGVLRYSYHSCKNRSCPKCHGTDSKRWIEKRQKELIPTTYFHIVFTIPKELHELVRSHQKLLYDVLLKAAARSLMKLVADPHYVGGKIAILAVLHTWTRAMGYHPHVHLMVPGGGLSEDGSWNPSRKNFLVPVKALSPIFRAKFMELARKALPEVVFPQSVWNTKWVVFAKPAVQGAKKVLNYLARYVHRIAITNNRILSIDDGEVTFRYKDSKKRC